MNRIFAPIFALALLFPSLALGAEVTIGDLVERDGLFYEKSTDVPFTGEVTGQGQGQIKDGKREGPWIAYRDNDLRWSHIVGQLGGEVKVYSAC